MLNQEQITLPPWAAFGVVSTDPPSSWKGSDKEWAKYQALLGPKHLRINVDGEAAYATLLGEYSELLAGDERASEFDPKAPTQFGLEVVAQTIKLDLQIACRTMAMLISVSRAVVAANAPEGRGREKAAGGIADDAGREARELFKLLRGVFPA